MAGGGLINIASESVPFDPHAVENEIYFSTDDVSQETLTLAGPPLSEDDQFTSAPRQNRLTYSAPSISTLFNLPEDNFRSFSSVKMNLEVKPGFLGGTSLGCDSNCDVYYSWDYTPQIKYMVPSKVYPGMQASVVLNPARAPNYKHAKQLAVDARIDGTMLNVEGLFDEGFNFHAYGEVGWTGIVETQHANPDAEITAFYRGAGHSLLDKQTLPTCLFDDTTCYNAQVMPTVTSISHN